MGIHKSILSLLFIPVAVCMAAEPTEYYGEKYLNRFAVFEKQDQFLKRLDNYDISKHFGQFLVGVFGDNYRKVDFYLKVVKDPSKPNFYVANGKNRLELSPRSSGEFKFKSFQFDVDTRGRIPWMKIVYDEENFKEMRFRGWKKIPKTSKYFFQYHKNRKE